MLRSLLDLSGRTAIVTGGSRGLGLQIAEALGEFGAAVALVARKPQELEEAAAHLRTLGIEAATVAADLGRPEDIPRVVETVMRARRRIDVLVNNAGATWGAPAEDHPPEAWRKVMDLNLTGTFLLTQAVGNAAMIPARRGRIVNIASIAGLKGNAPGGMGTIAYNTSKGGLVNFTRALAAEWGRHGITVNAIAPGWFPSKMTRATLARHEAAFAARTPLGRIGGAEDLKGAALLFASDAGAHITGQILAVDGGASAV
jgi:gluconate 5-dehydrogenase